MRRLTYYSLLKLFLLSLLVSCKENEVQIPKSSIEFIIKDEFDGLLDSVVCELSTENEKISMNSDANGYVKFDEINIGKYTLSYSKANYITGSEEIDVGIEPEKLELTLASGNTFLNLKDSVFNINYVNSTKTIQLESNSNWSIETDVNWIKTSVSSGAGNSEVTLTWEKSNDDYERVAHVIFKAGSIKRKLRVIQFPPLKLLKVNAVIGNEEKNIQDSVKLVFNKRITVKSITTSYEFCLSQILHKANANNLAFTYKCTFLGQSFPFTVSVLDGNEPYTFEIEAKFYTGKLNIPGYVMDYFVTDDNQYIWCVTTFPSALLKVSLKDLAIVKERALDFAPTGLAWNSYHNTLNIFNTRYVCNYADIESGACKDNYLMFVNTETLEITKRKIPLINGYDREWYLYPYVFPKGIYQFKNGSGLILLNNEYANTGWRFIDSFNSDSTYISSDHIRYNEIKYQEIFLNHDKTKMVMLHPWGSTSIDIYEMGNPTFRTFKSPISSGRSSRFLASKKHDRFFHGQVYEQFITDLNGYVSFITTLGTGYFYGGQDFSYKPGQEETIYYVSDGTFRILDYKIGFTTLTTQAISRLLRINTTTDGKNIIGLVQRNEGTTDILMFNVEETFVNQALRPNSTNRATPTISTTKSVWIRK
jgi:hypothetical protein